MAENPITYFAETDSRNKRVPFGIKNKDRDRHVYVIGKTGMGKSTLLENMAVQDIQNGHGMAFIDPHGKTADLLLEYVPKERIKDVIYFAPFDTEHPISFNVMEDVGANKRHLVANGLMSAFKKIWVDAWSARMEYILNNILLALLEYPDSTLVGVNRMLSDKDYRNRVVANISDPSVKSFWVDEFAKYGDRYMQEAGAAIQNKIGQFVSNPLVRNIIGQPKSSFDIRKVMDEKKILIINLSKGRVGEANANLLGSMIITKIYLGALSRADASESKLKSLPPFYLFVDEFQSFANESFADILSEARKYKLSLTIAHQYVEQMSEEVRSAVFGNVGTMISFRVGAFDAELLEKEYSPIFTAEDVVNLGFTQIYLKLMIDGVSSQPFSASSLPPIKKQDINYRDDIVESSRIHFAAPRIQVEEAIKKWHEPITAERPERSEKKELKDAKDTKSAAPGTAAPFNPVIDLSKKTQPTSSAPVPVTATVSAPKPAAATPSVAHTTPRAHAQPHSPTQTHSHPRPQVHASSSHAQAAAHAHTNAHSHAPKPISLDALKKPQLQNKGPSSQNLSQLKDALKDLLEKSKKEEPAKPVASSVSVAPPAPATVAAPVASAAVTPAPEKSAPRPQPASRPKVAQAPQPSKTFSKNEKPNEVPEDVLRRILDLPRKK